VLSKYPKIDKWAPRTPNAASACTSHMCLPGKDKDNFTLIVLFPVVLFL